MFTPLGVLLALGLGTHYCLGDSSLEPRTDKVIQCLTAAGVPQALPGTPEFATSSSPHNLRLPFTPRAIALPATVAHVQAAVACGRKNGVKVNARSGGHNYGSHGIGGEDGHLVIDLKFLNQTIIDSRTQIATVGPGAKLGNLAIAVGVGGHVLHGGWGYSTHNHGLFLDYLEEVQMVTANSAVVTASKTQNPELFWGLRGAGMSFGIATRFKFRTIPQPPEIQLFYTPFAWNLTQAKAGWQIYQDYVASKARPREMNIRVVISSGTFIGTQGTIFLFEGAYHGSKADYEKFIKPFNDPYMDSLLYANNNALLFSLPDAEPLESGPDDQISWLWIVSAIGGPNSAMSNDFPSQSTSYAHRSSLFLWELGDTVGADAAYPSDVGIPWVNTRHRVFENPQTVGRR
ncbi:hypothetical protein NEMBOFW57_008251 [Staphylotrichum longicolle]|uniref:FAD-binding PCMH-type domain-containing protein n=1 Tax=Staphylotrichum longicolle TaxID=669026 RepID=A0AAD4ERC0_9PEZI|nr:hypothetical protein NEMBOFW57_008251 [Staphylotrichum longicolle]